LGSNLLVDLPKKLICISIMSQLSQMNEMTVITVMTNYSYHAYDFLQFRLLKKNSKQTCVTIM
jgi:hypothetical protein